jgi:hypothetical protein
MEENNLHQKQTNKQAQGTYHGAEAAQSLRSSIIEQRCQLILSRQAALPPSSSTSKSAPSSSTVKQHRQAASPSSITDQFTAE